MDAELEKEVLSLPLDERIALVEELWDSIAAEAGAFDLTGEQRAELDRRLARYEQDPTTASPWEEVRKRIFGE